MGCLALTLLRYRGAPGGSVSTDTVYDISLETIIIEVSNTEGSTIYQLECSKLIVHYITLTGNSFTVEVCFGSVKLTTLCLQIILQNYHQPVEVHE